MPHGTCLLWQPELLWLHAVSDAGTAIAYYGIPILVIAFAMRREDLQFRYVFVLAGLFVLACGTTHVMGIWTLWYPDYGLEGLVKAATAIISIFSLGAMWFALPRALALPSPQQLRLTNSALEQEVRERQLAENEVRRLATELEARVRERTAELESANRQLRERVERERLLTREIHHRVKNNMQLMSSLLRLQADGLDPALADRLNPAQQRIAVMARIHEDLYGAGEMKGVRFNALAQDLSADIAELYGITDRVTFDFDIEPVTFGLDVALPLVLILNELVSNSCKHAFPDGRHGRIGIALSLDGAGMAKLAVKDDGVGSSDREFRSDEAFGERMGHLIVEHFAEQLGARLNVETVEGVYTRLEFNAETKERLNEQ